MTAIAAICNHEEAVLAADRQFSDAAGNRIASKCKIAICGNTAFAIRGVGDNGEGGSFCIYRIVREALGDGGQLSTLTERVRATLEPRLHEVAASIAEALRASSEPWIHIEVVLAGIEETIPSIGFVRFELTQQSELTLCCCGTNWDYPDLSAWFLPSSCRMMDKPALAPVARATNAIQYMIDECPQHFEGPVDVARVRRDGAQLLP